MKYLPRYGINVQVGLFVKKGSLFDHVPSDKITTEFGDDHRNMAGTLSEQLHCYATNVARIAQRTNPDLVLTVLPLASLAWKYALDHGLCSARPWIALDGHNPSRWIEDEIDSAAQIAVRTQIRAAYLSADKVVAASQELCGAIRAAYGLSEQKAVHIYNPVDVRSIRQVCSSRMRNSSSSPVILTAARLVRQKGIDTLLHAFRTVCNRTDARLVVLGTGPLGEELRALAKKLGVGEQVEFRGFHPAPWLLVAEADYYVLASRWEGFGHVLVEAMAAGTPVIATDCDFGPREVVSGGAGILVEPENAAQIAAALLQLMKDPDRRAGLVARAHSRASEFDTSLIVPLFANLIREVIANSSSREGAKSD
jgi:glycosyltransferase involved in cell wall biosynthesis